MRLLALLCVLLAAYGIGAAIEPHTAPLDRPAIERRCAAHRQVAVYPYAPSGRQVGVCVQPGTW